MEMQQTYQAPMAGTTSGYTGMTPTRMDTVTPQQSNTINPALLSLAMGFVPFQAWENTYDHQVALQRGTIFPSLDKPFLGWEAWKK